MGREAPISLHKLIVLISLSPYFALTWHHGCDLSQFVKSSEVLSGEGEEGALESSCSISYPDGFPSFFVTTQKFFLVLGRPCITDLAGNPTTPPIPA